MSAIKAATLLPAPTPGNDAALKEVIRGEETAPPAPEDEEEDAILLHREGGMNPGTSFKRPILILVIIHIPTQKWLSENFPSPSLSINAQTWLLRKV